MNYEFITNETKGYLHVILKGEDTLNVSLDYWKRIFDLIRKDGYKKVLVEEMLVGSPTTLDAYKLNNKLADMAIGITSKIAFFDHTPDHNSVNTFGETVALTRGVKIKVFASFSAAEKWLLNPPRKMT